MKSLMCQDDLYRMRERLLTVQEKDTPLWGVMTAAEMVCHVRGAFRTALGEIDSEPVEVPITRAMLKAVALWTPLPWKQNLKTVPALRRGTAAMRTGVFERDRAGAVDEMERFCRREQTRVDHAFFGTMSFEDWMRWGYLHTDHHLRQFGR